MKKRPCHVYSDSDALEGNSWTKTNTKQNHKWTRSRVLTAQNTLNLSMLVRELLMIVNLFERVFSHREWHCSFTTWCGILCQHSTLSLLYCGTDLIWYDAGMTSVQFALYMFLCSPLFFSYCPVYWINWTSSSSSKLVWKAKVSFRIGQKHPAI